MKQSAIELANMAKATRADLVGKSAELFTVNLQPSDGEQALDQMRRAGVLVE